ncbi:hypothetical protein FQN55_005730 [Onygenales sp. PD_40]|nr:hypothetical protein FQN55_005730 [Onygenales sp. PD_40]
MWYSIQSIRASRTLGWREGRVLFGGMEAPSLQHVRYRVQSAKLTDPDLDYAKGPAHGPEFKSRFGPLDDFDLSSPYPLPPVTRLT